MRAMDIETLFRPPEVSFFELFFAKLHVCKLILSEKLVLAQIGKFEKINPPRTFNPLSTEALRGI